MKLQKYNKAWVALFGVPLLTILVQNLLNVLASNGVVIPAGLETDLINVATWLVGIITAGVVYQVPNKEV